MRLILIAMFVALAPSAASAQVPFTPISNNRPPAQTIDLSGPRVGVTMLSDGIRAKASSEGMEVGPVISQFGWQIEKRFLTSPTGGTAVTEFVGLIGGVEQDKLLPSLSWLVGYRTAMGVEFAAGPNLSASGGAFVFAAGLTFQAGSLNLPVNFAIVPSRHGTRVSMLAGFNTRRR